jgi:alkylated DNA repair dioxygenase AlkB
LSQATCRPSVSEPIPGLFLFDNFLSLEEEDFIIADLDQKHSTEQHAWTRERHTGSHFDKRFGIDHDLWSKHLRPPSNPMPCWFREIVWPKLKLISSLQNCIPNEMNVIDYQRSRGDYLKSHMDDRVKYREPIANLSLAGDCYMVFAQERDPSVPAKRILLRRRTLQILTGKARYEWTHGIEASDILSDRCVSVTMRETVGSVSERAVKRIE